MATRRKSSQVSKSSHRKFEGFTDLLSRLEVEAEKVVRRFIERAENSSRELKKGISSLLDQVRVESLTSLANEKKEDLRKLADDVISRAKEIQVLALGNLNRDELVRDAKKNLDELIEKINSSDILARAKSTAMTTRNQVLSILRIPSQDDVVKISRKITTLESRVDKLTRKAA